MAAPPVLYYRNGCHLCEELAAVLFRGWPDHAETLEWRDVDQNDDWRDLHGEFVPVLMVGEEVVCRLRPDIDRISRYFGAIANPL